MLINRDTVTIRPDAEDLERIDALVRAGLFPDRASATHFLLAEGVNRNNGVLDTIRNRAEEIHSARKQLCSRSGEAEASSSNLKCAIEALKESVARHEAEQQQTIQASARLYEQRQRAASEVIARVEEYVNRMATSSKDFDKAVAEYRLEVGRFTNDVVRLETDAAQSATVAGGTGAAGAIGGVGVATLAPTAALAIATTFGTASTGTAISALSGAAAANAALAWLGGGALAAGGGGIAAGSALLALAGPIGWSVAGTAVVGAAVFMYLRNRQLTETAGERRVAVEAGIRSLVATKHKIDGLANRIAEHADGCLADTRWLIEHAPADYQQFDVPQKERLAALVNHIRSLGKLIVERITNEHA